MASETEICNLAIGHIGTGKEIANLETEKSTEASACRRYYAMLRDQVLRDYPWPFATKFIALGLVEEDPNDEWAYSYRYPTDCLAFRRILSGERTDTNDTRVPYKVAQDSEGLLIYTDQSEAEAEYTKRETDPQRYPPDFTMALSYLLAATIAPIISAGDPFKRGDHALQMYQYMIGAAHGNAQNEEQDDPTPDSEFIRARE